ncbi:hypothetical protein [Synechococcus sp. KORDI-52]|uniref:hypothetical protein n=1 Tax=Synechococcus sp. KORDI-52 TaxID=585425 RepID=UPI00138E2E2F|nr:hypothetical protein [Synechococcus sp. KORDI-52]
MNLPVRKEMLNNILSLASEAVIREVESATGIKVSGLTNAEAAVEGFLGVTVDVLRNVLFQRGGLPTDVVLKIQEITVVTDVTDKDLVAATKAKLAVIKE